MASHGMAAPAGAGAATVRELARVGLSNRQLGAPYVGLGCGSRLPLLRRGPTHGKRHGTAMATMSVDTVQPQPGAGVRMRPAVSPYEPSGQSGSYAFEAPLRGRPEPMGASIDPTTGATNFAVLSSNATAVSLVLFSEGDLYNGRVTHELQLNPDFNRTGDIWHVMLPQLDSNLLYGYRVFGPHQEAVEGAEGHRFDPSAVVLDPYATAIIGRRRFGELGPELAFGEYGVHGLARTWPQCAGALPSPHHTFDWEGDQPLKLPMEDLVIYEMHVRGFTQHESSGLPWEQRGTFAGVVARLDYLAALGINAIELLPVQEFNELEYYTLIPGTDTHRYNFWGYSTVNYFSPMSRFSAAAAGGGGGHEVINEFKGMVKEAHKRGIEVILDVVFNHTAEGNEQGPCLSFRGLDNRVYYMLAPEGQYYNYSGCGNTLNCNHPSVRQFIVDCLRYWVVEMHVDGFRFDLASIMTRAHSMWHQQEAAGEVEGEPTAVHSGGAIVNQDGIMTDGAGVPTGTPLPDPPLVEMISADPVLQNTKLIAEAWDCDGLNQVGAFPHYEGRWAEWNGHFRDTVRQFVKGTDGNWVSLMASALCGSPHIYGTAEAPDTDWWGTNGGAKWRGGRGPHHSVNFITAHDGFTLADLVSYNEKHNEANGEDNRDGETHNLSWNCGEEGESSEPSVQLLRQRQLRNMACALLLAQGVPMVLMGDEYGASKGGNNNTYCHDSPLNYFNWDEMHGASAGYGRFFRHLVNFRRARSELRRQQHPDGGVIQWHGIEPNEEPDWSDTSRFLAFTLRNDAGGGIYVAFNVGHLPATPALPLWGGRQWQPLVDTGKAAPLDFLAADNVLSAEQVEVARGAMAHWLMVGCYPMTPWSCTVLESVPYTPPRATMADPPADRQQLMQPPALREQPTTPRRMPYRPSFSARNGFRADVSASRGGRDSDPPAADFWASQSHTAPAESYAGYEQSPPMDTAAIEAARIENERLRAALSEKLRRINSSD